MRTSPYYTDSRVTLYHGKALDIARQLPAGSVECIVTSPPYYGLRDYGVDGQYGMENSPAEYVENIRILFAELRRVLADDGTLWLNLGDSYSGSCGNQGRKETCGTQRPVNGPMIQPVHDGRYGDTAATRTGAIKPGAPPAKSLLGIPWQVARALQVPQYIGNIRCEADRAWLAGWIDGEGTISYNERDRGPDHSPTHDVCVFVTNCDDAPLHQFAGICGGNVYVHDNGTRENRYGKRVVHRWQMGTHESAMVLREIYPYLRTKRKQAALIWSLYSTLRHRNGHGRTPPDVLARRREIAAMVRNLNTGVDVELPAWVIEPPAAEEPGWIMRNAIVWNKPNAMPESVTDRLSGRYEHVFMFSKSRRYWFDLDAIREPHAKVSIARSKRARLTAYAPAGQSPSRRGQTIADELGRNPGDVWRINTKPFRAAHFAVMPPELAQKCILAGCKPGGVVLDPCSGAGTSGQAAQRTGRRYVGIDINADYLDLSLRTRLRDAALDFEADARTDGESA